MLASFTPVLVQGKILCTLKHNITNSTCYMYDASIVGKNLKGSRSPVQNPITVIGLFTQIKTAQWQGYLYC